MRLLKFYDENKKILWGFLFAIGILCLPRLGFAEEWLHTTIQTKDSDIIDLQKPTVYQNFSFDGCTGGTPGKGSWQGKTCKIGLKASSDVISPSMVSLMIISEDQPESSVCSADLTVMYSQKNNQESDFTEKLSKIDCYGKHSTLNLQKVGDDSYVLTMK